MSNDIDKHQHYEALSAQFYGINLAALTTCALAGYRGAEAVSSNNAVKVAGAFAGLATGVLTYIFVDKISRNQEKKEQENDYNFMAALMQRLASDKSSDK